MKYSFKARIYKTGINWAVDVPPEVSASLKTERGYIRVKGKINGFEFRKSLVPVKGSPYRLFVNLVMMKGGKTALSETAEFEIEQDTEPAPVKEYSMHPVLLKHLKLQKLESEFDALTSARKRDILTYLNSLKHTETLNRNIDKVIRGLKKKVRDLRIP